jgi:hypothetical protein
MATIYACIRRTKPQWQNCSTESSHRIRFKETEILAKVSLNMNQHIKERDRNKTMLEQHQQRGWIQI